jgi:hypothetical protein
VQIARLAVLIGLLSAILLPALVEAGRDSVGDSSSEARSLETPAAFGGDPPKYTLLEQQPESAPRPRLRSWELEAIRVVGERQSPLQEEERVGSYGQPRWTTSRRFPTTRVYVIPEGKIEVEAWSRNTFNRDRDGSVDNRFLQELEVGLPHRFQIDLYFRQDWNSTETKAFLGSQFEVRWALADWNKIPGNPTLYLEYLLLDKRPDRLEPKLLFGGEITTGWHWGLNLVGEFELSGHPKEHEYQVTTAVSRTIVDSKFSLGVETILELTDTSGHRGEFNRSLVIGPSLQWRPLKPLTINLAPLFGVTGESPRAQIWLNVGWEF